MNDENKFNKNAVFIFLLGFLMSTGLRFIDEKPEYYFKFGTKLEIQKEAKEIRAIYKKDTAEYINTGSNTFIFKDKYEQNIKDSISRVVDSIKQENIRQRNKSIDSLKAFQDSVDAKTKYQINYLKKSHDSLKYRR